MDIDLDKLEAIAKAARIKGLKEAKTLIWKDDGRALSRYDGDEIDDRIRELGGEP